MKIITVSVLIAGFLAETGAFASSRHSLILSPAPNAAVSKAPVLLTLSVPDRIEGDVPDFNVTVNGIAFTGQFTPVRNSAVSTLLTKRYLIVGKNEIAVQYGYHDRASTSFTYSPPPSTQPDSGEPGSGTASSAPDYLTIHTRVVNGAGVNPGDYVIQVGSNNYPAEDIGTLSAFHVLALDRSSGDVVADFTVATPNLRAEVEQEITQKCTGVYGCVVILSSLQNSGVTTCFTQKPSMCGDFDPGLFLAGIGGSTRLNYLNGQNVVYSLITTVGTGGNNWRPGGQGNERVDCIGPGSTCSAEPYFGNSPVIRQGDGDIQGALVLDSAGALAFAYIERPAFSLAPSSKASHTNTITVNGSSYSASLGNTVASGGFHLVIVDRTVLSLQANLIFPTTTDGLQDLHNTLRAWTNSSQDYLFFLTSVGSLAHNSTPGGSQQATNWLKVATDLISLGGTYSVFEQLGEGDDYSLVGATVVPAEDAYGNQIAKFLAAEVSSIITKATTSASSGAGNQLIGLLKQDHQGFYYPLTYSSQSLFGTPGSAVLDAIALQAPVRWPLTPEKDTCQGDSSANGRLTAYQAVSYYLTANADGVGGTQDIRSDYAYSTFPWQSDASTIYQTSYDKVQTWAQANQPALLNFTQTDFCRVQAQLYAELTFVQMTHAYETELEGTLNGSQSVLSNRLTQVYNDLSDELQPPNPSQSSTSTDILGGVSAVLSVLSYTTPENPALALALDAGSVGISYGMSLDNDTDGVPNVGDELRGTLAALAANTTIQFINANQTMGNMFSLIYADWGRLHNLGLLISGSDTQKPLDWNDNDKGYYYSGLFNAMGQKYVASFLGALYQRYRWGDITSGYEPATNLQEVCDLYGASNGFDSGCVLAQHFDGSDWIRLPSSFNGQTPCGNCGNDGNYWDDYLIAGNAEIIDEFNPDGPDHYSARGSYPYDSVMKQLFTPAGKASSSTDPDYDPGLQLGLYRPWLFLKTPEIPNATLTFKRE